MGRPNEGRLTFRAAADEWLDSRIHVAPRTRTGYAMVLKVRVLPTFSKRRVASIDGDDIQTWVNKQAQLHAPNTVQNSINVLHQVFKFAVKRGRIATNPACRSNGLTAFWHVRLRHPRGVPFGGLLAPRRACAASNPLQTDRPLPGFGQFRTQTSPVTLEQGPRGTIRPAPSSGTGRLGQQVGVRAR
jgi:hypothetical protein